MSKIEIEEIYKQSVMILEFLHQHNISRYESGKSKTLSNSALEYKDIVEQTYKNNDLKGLKHLRKDLGQMANSLPRSTKVQINNKLNGK